MQAELGALRDEVEVLRSEVVQLRSELAVVRRALQRVQSAPSSAAGEAEESFAISAVSVPSTVEGVAAAASAEVPAARVADLTWSEREDIAREVGLFLRRSLSGQHRGSSGRDACPLASRYWIVVRDFDGVVYSPPRVFARWSSGKAWWISR